MNNNLAGLATKVRKQVLKMSYESQVGHVGSAFSIVEILVLLYFKLLNVNRHNPKFPLRDRFILSKGHAAPALYAVLLEKGFLTKSQLSGYCRDGGSLEEHPSFHTKGIEVSTGSLGHGLSMAVGFALAAKIKKVKYKVYVLMSDAECDEGGTWEALLSAAHHKLDNLVVFLDYNKVQALGVKREVLNIEPLVKKWQSFGWSVKEAEGHDFSSLERAHSSLIKSKKPKVIICHTVRGKGVTFMENKLEWHYKNPTREDVTNAFKQLK